MVSIDDYGGRNKEEGVVHSTTVKRAYMQQARIWHPDKNPDNAQEAKTRFQKISAAYQKLAIEEDSDEADFWADDDFYDENDDGWEFGLAEDLFKHMWRMFGSNPPGGFVHIPMGPDITVSFPAAALFADALPRDGQQGPRSFQPNRKTEEEVLEEEDWLKQKVAEARQKRRKQQEKAVAAKAAESKRRAALALEAEVAAAAAFKPVRPAMASRTETSITLNLVKKGAAQDLGDVIWQLEFHAVGSNKGWTTVESTQPVATAEPLEPGTKYEFRARKGAHLADQLILSQWSTTAAYVTAGDPPKAAQAQKEAPEAQKSRQKVKAAKAKPQQQQQAKEVDSEEERERLEVYRAKERAKEEAIREALDQAAAEYAAEAAKLAAVAKEAPKARQQSKAKSKATRTRLSRKKATQSEDNFWAPVVPQPKRTALGDLPRVDAPTTKHISFAEAFQFAPDGGSSWGPVDPPASELERMQLEEAVQLSLALEQSQHGASREFEESKEYSHALDNQFADAFGGVAAKQPREESAAPPTPPLPTKSMQEAWGNGNDWDEDDGRAWEPAVATPPQHWAGSRQPLSDEGSCWSAGEQVSQPQPHSYQPQGSAGPNSSLAQPAHKTWAQSDAVDGPSWGRQQEAVWPQTQQGHNTDADAQAHQPQTAAGAQHGSWGIQEQLWQRQQQQQQVADVGGWNQTADGEGKDDLVLPVEAAATGGWGQTAEAKVKGAAKEIVAPGDWGQAAAATEGDWGGAEPTQDGKAGAAEDGPWEWKPTPNENVVRRKRWEPGPTLSPDPVPKGGWGNTPKNANPAHWGETPENGWGGAGTESEGGWGPSQTKRPPQKQVTQQQEPQARQPGWAAPPRAGAEAPPGRQQAQAAWGGPQAQQSQQRQPSWGGESSSQAEGWGGTAPAAHASAAEAVDDWWSEPKAEGSSGQPASGWGSVASSSQAAATGQAPISRQAPADLPQKNGLPRKTAPRSSGPTAPAAAQGAAAANGAYDVFMDLFPTERR